MSGLLVDARHVQTRQLRFGFVSRGSVFLQSLVELALLLVRATSLAVFLREGGFLN